MEIIKCPNCGGEVLSTQSSCFHCGYNFKTNKQKIETPFTLNEEPINSVPPTHTVKPSTTAPTQNRPKTALSEDRIKALVPFGIFLIVFSIIVILFSTIMYFIAGAPVGAMIALYLFSAAFIVGGYAMINYKKRLDNGGASNGNKTTAPVNEKKKRIILTLSSSLLAILSLLMIFFATGGLRIIFIGTMIWSIVLIFVNASKIK